MEETIKEGGFLWEADQKFKDEANITKYMSWLAAERGLSFADYEELWQWSVDELEEFWASIWDYFQVESSQPYEKVLADQKMPGAEWFTGSRVNYAKNIMRNSQPDNIAIYAESETQGSRDITWGQLTKDVLVLATELRKMGIGRGTESVLICRIFTKRLLHSLPQRALERFGAAVHRILARKVFWTVSSRSSRKF